MHKLLAVLTAITLLAGLGAATNQVKPIAGSDNRAQPVEVCCDDADGDGIGDIVSELAHHHTGEEKWVKTVVELARDTDDGKEDCCFDYNDRITALAHNGDTTDLVAYASPALADLDGDGRLDIVTGNTNSRERSARKGRNPQTGKEIKIPAK